jgi:6-phosphogluconate dehydrogenase
MTRTYEVGLAGLAVMGQNLARNLAGSGIPLVVYNRTVETTVRFLADKAAGLPIEGAFSPGEFADKLARPRKIILMVKAGQPVDDMVDQLLAFLESGDIVIDGGNSHFADTRRRVRELAARGIHFLGMGVSGGEEGALKGPSLMPGGDRIAYEQVAPFLKRIAAKVPGGVCCQYVGPDGAGHFVKMVHNGIEYGDMQLISEAYAVLRQALGLGAGELRDIFAAWNDGVLKSYLIEITADIFSRRDDETGLPVVDVIVDKAGQKGTGKWTIQAALDLGIPIPTIAEAVFARYISNQKTERLAASGVLAGPAGPFRGEKTPFITAVRDALYASKICSYAQGFSLLGAASGEYGWQLSCGDIALLWRGGCIIRAAFLERIEESFRDNPALASLFIAPFFRDALAAAQENWRLVVTTAKHLGIPTPAFSSALDYYDSYRAATLPANLIQAQRDYFGAHTFERIDRSGSFHFDW